MKKFILLPIISATILSSCSKDKNELQPKLYNESRTPVNSDLQASLASNLAKRPAPSQPNDPGFMDLTKQPAAPEVFVNQQVGLGVSPGTTNDKMGIPVVPAEMNPATANIIQPDPINFPADAQTNLTAQSPSTPDTIQQAQVTNPAASLPAVQAMPPQQIQPASSPTYQNMVNNIQGASRPTTLSDYRGNGSTPKSLMPGYESPLNSQQGPSVSATVATPPAANPKSMSQSSAVSKHTNYANPQSLSASNITPVAAPTMPVASIQKITTHTETTQQIIKE